MLTITYVVARAHEREFVTSYACIRYAKCTIPKDKINKLINGSRAVVKTHIFRGVAIIAFQAWFRFAAILDLSLVLISTSCKTTYNVLRILLS